MMLQYSCKKTGQVVDVDSTTLPVPSTEYLVRRGFREYMDNYHAGVTAKEHGADKCAELVRPMVDEALARLVAGEVPGTRVPADPRLAKVRAAVAHIGPVSDEEFAKILADFERAVAKRKIAA